MQINTHDIDDLLTTGAPIQTINEHLAGGHHTSTHKALTCKYQASQAGSSRSICAVTALNCVRLAFQLEAREGDGETFFPSLCSEEMMNQVMNVTNDLLFDNHLEIDDLLEVPIFKETVISTVREQCHHSLETLKDLFIRLFPPDSSKPMLAVVVTQTPEHFVCFRFRSSVSCIFVIFDAHSRSEHPSGPAFILASDVDTIATHLHQLLTQSSISKSASDITANPYSFTALIVKSRESLFTIDTQDLLTKSVAFLSEKLAPVDHAASNLDLDTPVSSHHEQLRVRAETLRTQKLVHASHKQDNNRPASHTRPSTRLTRRSEFGWQLNLQLSGTTSAVDPKNNNLAEPSKPLEVKKSRSTTLDLPYKSEFDWFKSLVPPSRLDGEEVNISLSSASRADVENIPDNPLSHMRSRTDFGWQLALQQTLKTDRHKLEDLEITASTVVSQADIQMHGVLLGKEKEASDEVSATQPFSKGSVSAWEDALMKQLQEEEELVASSAGFLSQESAWLLAYRKRLETEEDKAVNAVASSSSHTQLGQKEITSAFPHELEFKPFPFTEDESSTIHHHPRHSPLFPSYFDAVLSSNREFTTLELPSSEFPAESQECGVCSELYGTSKIIQLPTCTHTFCKECLRTFTKTKISEGRYPIFCPVCAIERTRINRSYVTQAIVDKLELSKQDLDKFDALHLISHSVILHCPKCKQTMNVDRGEYASQRIITCPLSACRHMWCKECLKPLASSQTEHNCKQHGFERLMRKKGWKYCPGCKTPVQKETGCNHMTCVSPGCNVHFCYRCGVSIIDTSNGGDVGSAVTEHYVDCVMFEKHRRCMIQ